MLVHWFLLANKSALRCSSLCRLQTKLHQQVLASALRVNLLLAYLLLQLGLVWLGLGLNRVLLLQDLLL